MKIAVTSEGKTLEAQADPRFGRCPFFVIVDSESLEFEALENEAVGAAGGAGVQAAQAVAGKGVQAVITGQAGPNAFQALHAAGVEVYTGASGTVKDVLEDFKAGKLNKTGAPTVGSHFGMGGRGGGGGNRRR